MKVLTRCQDNLHLLISNHSPTANKERICPAVTEFETAVLTAITRAAANYNGEKIEELATELQKANIIA